MKSFEDRDWKENFRMSKSTFLYICNGLRKCIEERPKIHFNRLRLHENCIHACS